MSTAQIELRPIQAGDEPLLLAIYSSTRLEELAPLGWTAEQQRAFLTQQFGAQHAYYQANFSAATFSVVLVDGEPAGRLYVDRRPDEIRIVDIALLPQFRGAGIGSRLLRALLDEAAATERTVGIHVEKTNPALRLYERLGFRISADQGVYWMMHWTPPAEQRATDIAD